MRSTQFRIVIAAGALLCATFLLSAETPKTSLPSNLSQVKELITDDKAGDVKAIQDIIKQWHGPARDAGLQSLLDMVGRIGHRYNHRDRELNEAMVVFGNDAVEPLVSMLTDQERSLYALRGLALLVPTSVDPLVETLERQKLTPEARVAAIRALSEREAAARLRLNKQSSMQVVQGLTTALSDPNVYVRCEAAKGLSQLGQFGREFGPALLETLPASVDPLLACFRASESTDLRLAVLKALADIGPTDSDATEFLVDLSDRATDSRERRQVARALSSSGLQLKADGKNESDQLQTVLVSLNLMMGSDDDTVARIASEGLAAIGEEALPTLTESLGVENANRRRFAAYAAGRLGTKAASLKPALLARLDDSDAMVRRNVAEAIGRLADKGVVDQLIRQIDDKNAGVKLAVIDALNRLDADNPYVVDTVSRARESLSHDDAYGALSEAERNELNDERYEMGGPLAGLPLPLFPTEHGEPLGYPGVLPNDPSTGDEGFTPQWHLHPESVENWRSIEMKYKPSRSLFDLQSMLKNWKASELVPQYSEQYAEPLYWLHRFRPAKILDRKKKPVTVARSSAEGPEFNLNLGKLEPGTYCISVIGAVETQHITRARKPLYMTMRVNDRVDGSVSNYRMRLGYVDQFFSVAEYYFHAPESRNYEAMIRVDNDSEVDLLVHNIELHDVLVGRTRRALKQSQTVAKPPQSTKHWDALSEQRLAHDAELWGSYPPINTQIGLAQLSATNSRAKYRYGIDGMPAEEVRKKYGKWEEGDGRVLAVNKKLGLEYTIEDLSNGRSLPDPYPYKDDGAGLYTPPTAEDEEGQNWVPIGETVTRRFINYRRDAIKDVQTYAETGDEVAARRAAVRLLRIAYDLPSHVAGQSLGFVTMQPGAFNKDMRHRNRNTSFYATVGQYGPINLMRAYDQLYDYIRGNEDLALSVKRYVPWVQDSSDLIEIIDVNMVQETVKRYMRYQCNDGNNPAEVAEIAGIAGNVEATYSWMEWLFVQTWMYPLNTSGLPDMLVTGNGRDGAKYIGSHTYGELENAALSGESTEVYLKSGGSADFDLRDPFRFPKVHATCHWFIRARLAGLYPPRIGDVSGPTAYYGFGMHNQPHFENGMRQGWRWMKDPKFAWMLVNLYEQGDMSDEEWADVQKAADKIKRAPWLDQRSRVLTNWFGTLESGVEHDDMRFRRNVMLRVGQGWGHAQNDTLDLQVLAHGLPMTVNGGMRSGYSRPADKRSNMHNLVEVDAQDWMGHSWIREMSDADGARYMQAEAVPPSNLQNVSLNRRQVALIDVDEGKGSKQLTNKQVHPLYRELDPTVTTPNSYVFDVTRISGGKLHTYCFHGSCEDEFRSNVNFSSHDSLPPLEKEYLRKFPDHSRSLGADAPDTVVATWRFPRGEEILWSEDRLTRTPINEQTPRKYTRLHLLGQSGNRVLSGYYYSHKGKHGFTKLFAQQRSEEESDAVFPAIIEPFVGQPFVKQVQLLPIAQNDTDALRGVAVQVETVNGHRDLCFADGRPDKLRQVAGAQIQGAFAYVSRDDTGLRQATLTGGTQLTTEGITLEAAASQRTGRVIEVDYHKKIIVIDQPWPTTAGGGERILEIGSGSHWTSVNVIRVEPRGKQTALHLRLGADFYLARVKEVDQEKNEIACSLGMAMLGGNPCPGLDKDLVASNEDGTKFWRAEYMGGSRSEGAYRFRLDGDVSMEDFGRTHGFRIWEYGVGDTVRQSTFVSIQRAKPNEFQITADVPVQGNINGKAFKLNQEQLSDTNTVKAAAN